VDVVNILFLKGICESTNNTAYDWCFNTDMVRYLNALVHPMIDNVFLWVNVFKILLVMFVRSK
jgi:hypothetical protein